MKDTRFFTNILDVKDIYL